MNHILIIDEDTDVLRLLRIKLSAAGYEVSLARDGQEAVALAVQHAPELVILEPRLPDLDGYTLLRRLRKDFKPAPLVVVLSADGSDEDIAAAFAAGAADYLSKPFSPQVLLERMRVNWIRSGQRAVPSSER